MIKDANFKFLEETYLTGTRILYFQMKDGVLRFSSLFDIMTNEKFVEFTFDQVLSNKVISKFLFTYYNIEFKETILTKSINVETEEYLKYIYPNDIIIFKRRNDEFTELWYSDACSDEMLTTIELIGN